MAKRCRAGISFLLPIVSVAHQVAAVDPKQADIAGSSGLLESDADIASAVNQREVAVRKVVNVLQIPGKEQVLPVKFGIES